MVDSHTPGPWTVKIVPQVDYSGNPIGAIAYIKADTGHKEIAVLYGDDAQAANAHVIAVAPELLAYAKLEQQIDEFDCPHDAEARCRCGEVANQMIGRARELRAALIAKAEPVSVPQEAPPS